MGITNFKNDVKAKFNRLKAKSGAVNTQKILADRRVEDARQQAIQKMVEFLTKNGVDINDQDSIREFLAKLEERNPDFVVLFQSIFDKLFPQGESVSTQPSQQAAPVSPQTVQ